MPLKPPLLLARAHQPLAAASRATECQRRAGPAAVVTGPMTPAPFGETDLPSDRPEVQTLDHWFFCLGSGAAMARGLPALHQPC